MNAELLEKLNTLLNQDSRARDRFNSLPRYMQKAYNEKSQESESAWKMIHGLLTVRTFSKSVPMRLFNPAAQVHTWRDVKSRF
jgi:hypothetical protein